MKPARYHSHAGLVCMLLLAWTLCAPARAVDFAGGTGDPNDPYQIATAEQLIAIGSDPNLLDKHFALVADINLDPNLPGGVVFTKAVIPFFHGRIGFTGSFDGRGHTIRHLTIRAKAGSYVGLFGLIRETAWVRCLGLEDISIAVEDKHYLCGGLANSNEGTIIDCYVTGSISAGAQSEQIGPVAAFCSGNIVNCYSATRISTGASSRYVGGLVGWLDNDGNLTNCYFCGSISTGQGARRIGAVAGYWGAYAFGGAVERCFWLMPTVGVLDASGAVGLTFEQISDARTFITAGWDFVRERDNGTADVWFMPPDGGGPRLSAFSPDYPPRTLPGSGTPQDPYRIVTVEDLGVLHRMDWSASYVVANDMDLSGVMWSPAVLPCFNGQFDGAGHTISSLSIRGGGYLGLFGILGASASVKDLTVENATVAGGNCASYVAVLAGTNHGTITDCHTAGTVTGAAEGEYFGGLVGDTDGTIADCSARGAISGDGDECLGGLTGQNRGEIVRCHAAVDISGLDSQYLGGLVGENRLGAIRDSFATGNILGSGSTPWSYGGLVGQAGGSISRCYASGRVSGPEGAGDVGGLVGRTWGCTMANCYATGSVSAGKSSHAVGGLVGWNWKSTLTDCYAVGAVFVDASGKDVGGLIGQDEASAVINCFWDGQSSGCSVSAAGVGLPTAEMQRVQTFLAAGWDLAGERANGTAETWSMPEDLHYPELAVFSRSFSPPKLTGSGTPDNPYEVRTAEDLGAICWSDPAGCYRLMGDMDLTGITWSVAPVPDFDGTFDGGQFRISNLKVQGAKRLGLFGVLHAHATVSRLHVDNFDIMAWDYSGYLGGLAGINLGAITDCHVTGQVLAGYHSESLGGLAGDNLGTIANCSARTHVSGGDTAAYLGGLVGLDSGSIRSSYAAGDVSGGDRSGRLGGLVGHGGGTITDCYATGDVSVGSDANNVGGLVGDVCGGDAAKCYSVGMVLAGQGGDYLGSLVGDVCGSDTVSSCYFLKRADGGLPDNKTGVSLTDSEMRQQGSFVGWDFENVWIICEGRDYPRLRWEGVECGAEQ